MKPKPSYIVAAVTQASDGGGTVLGAYDDIGPGFGNYEPESDGSRRWLVSSLIAAAVAILIAAIMVGALTGSFSDADSEATVDSEGAIAATGTESTSGEDAADAATQVDQSGASVSGDVTEAPDLFVRGSATKSEGDNKPGDPEAAGSSTTADPDGSSALPEGATTSLVAAAGATTVAAGATTGIGDETTATTADTSQTTEAATGATTTTSAKTTSEATTQTTVEAPATTQAPTTAPPTTTGGGGNTCASNGEFERVYRDDFDGSSVNSNWTLYNSSGNSGFGLRRPSAITVANGMLVITAKMENGSLVSGGMSLKRDMAYGKYVFRVRTDNDPSQAVSGVILTWPQAGNNHRNGENNMYETLTKTPSRNPFFSFIHKPFGNASTQEFYQHNADGSQFQVMSMEWTPNRITITRQGPGSSSSDSWTVNETGSDLIPDVPHHLAIQLDGWKDSIGGTVRMEVDYVEVYKYCG